MSDMFSGTPGNHVFYVVFAPTDTANYNAVRDILVAAEVAALSPASFCNALRNRA